MNALLPNRAHMAKHFFPPPKRSKRQQPKISQPGHQTRMKPRPIVDDPDYRGTNKLYGEVAIVTGGDSGIGQAAALLYAKEGARIVVVYLDEHEDAKTTKHLIELYGGEALLIAGDVGSETFAKKIVRETMKRFGQIDIVVNNAAEQHPQETIEGITERQLEKTFRTNIFSQFFLVKAALAHLKPGARIINTTSVTAYRGSGHLLDYAATKGAIVAFTRSLAHMLLDKEIRVNAVAPGPVWTPLIPASFKKEKIKDFGSQSPMKRAGEPIEIAPSFLFLALSENSFMTGQVLHPNGGEIISG